MNMVLQRQYLWPAPASIALVAIGPREPRFEALDRHLLARPDDARATLIRFFESADGDDAGAL